MSLPNFAIRYKYNMNLLYDRGLWREQINFTIIVGYEGLRLWCRWVVIMGLVLVVLWLCIIVGRLWALIQVHPTC